MSIEVICHPSLALIKYWGKEDEALNTAATPSLALNLEALVTRTKVTLAKKDEVMINLAQADIERFTPFFNEVRKRFKREEHFSVVSTNNFPTSSGLASSSSGFAALSFACARLLEKEAPLHKISEIARLGSASSARAVFPGFVALEVGALAATPLFDESYWKELRIVVAKVTDKQKPLSSRSAMKRTKETSPFYQEWVRNSKILFKEALSALQEKNLDKLGPLMRQSTYQMFATMLGAFPPIIYWKEETLALLHTLESLRGEGLSVFETCDAGPQVKILIEEKNLKSLEESLKIRHPEIDLMVSSVGGGVREA